MGFPKSDDFLSSKFPIFLPPCAQCSAITMSIYHESHQTDHYWQKKSAPYCVSDPDDVRVQSERPIQYAFYDSLTYLWKPLVKGIALHLYFIPTATLARSNSSFSVSVAKFERTNSHSAVQVQVQAKTHQVHGLLHNPSVGTNTLQTLCKYCTCCFDSPCMDYFWTALADTPKQVTTLLNQHLWDLKGSCVIAHVYKLIQKFIMDEPCTCYTGQYALQTCIFLGMTYSLCSFSMHSLHPLPCH